MNRISELRKKLGLTQIRLGEEIGVSQQTISKYENVDENISGDMLLALSKLRSNGMPVPLLRNGYSIFNGTKYR